MKILTTLSLIICTGTLWGQIPSNGLIGRWEFSGNANDLSISANHGNVTGATLTTDRCGNANSAYSFNGSTDYITMQMAGPSGANSRSIAFWAKTNNTNTSALFTYGSPGFAEAFQVQYNYGCAGLGLDVNAEQITRGSACITDNNWHHIALVFNGSGNQQMFSTDFYVDGQLLSSQLSCGAGNGTQVLNTGTQTPITIGHDSSPNPIRWFQGSLDDYFLYDRALTASEILQLFNACTMPLSGNTNLCTGSTSTYSIPAMPGATVIWNLPNGWTGTSSTNVITVNTGTNSSIGTISASILTGCGGMLTLASKTVSVSRCTSISQPEAELALSLYPNPANEFVTIETSNASAFVISITDMTGHLILHENFIGKTQLNIKDLNSGLYFITVKMNNGSQKTVKLVKD